MAGRFLRYLLAELTRFVPLLAGDGVGRFGVGVDVGFALDVDVDPVERAGEAEGAPVVLVGGGEVGRPPRGEPGPGEGEPAPDGALHLAGSDDRPVEQQL